jgi:hypothetical protein
LQQVSDPAKASLIARVAAWDGQPPLTPEVGVDEHREADSPQSPDQAVESGSVVEVAVAADDRLDA